MSVPEKTAACTRRVCLKRVLSLSLAGGYLGLARGTAAPETAAKLWAPWDESEEKAIAGSRMGDLIMSWREAGYSCAESVLGAALNHLDLSEEWVWVAGGFGGGLGKRQLCGLLTGGVMALGLSAGKSNRDRKAFRREIGRQRDAFWAWWTRRAPLNCLDLRPLYDSEGFSRMARRVALRLETQFNTMKRGG